MGVAPDARAHDALRLAGHAAPFALSCGLSMAVSYLIWGQSLSPAPPRLVLITGLSIVVLKTWMMAAVLSKFASTRSCVLGSRFLRSALAGLVDGWLAMLPLLLLSDLALLYRGIDLLAGLWLFFGSTGVVAWALLPLVRVIRPDCGRCPSCGYDLRASKDYCPECGAAATAAAQPIGAGTAIDTEAEDRGIVVTDEQVSWPVPAVGRRAEVLQAIGSPPLGASSPRCTSSRSAWWQPLFCSLTSCARTTQGASRRSALPSRVPTSWAS